MEHASTQAALDYMKKLAGVSYDFELAQKLGLKVNAGHGLNYENVHRMHEIEGLQELNIGHSIISRAVFTGLPEAVSKMNTLIK